MSWLPLEINNEINRLVDEYNEANVINKNDYNINTINSGFDESSNYLGVKLDFDYIDNDLMEGSTESSTPKSALDEIFANNVSEDEDNPFNNDSIDPIDNINNASDTSDDEDDI